jgi:hypothetical protein
MSQMVLQFADNATLLATPGGEQIIFSSIYTMSAEEIKQLLIEILHLPETERTNEIANTLVEIVAGFLNAETLLELLIMITAVPDRMSRTISLLQQQLIGQEINFRAGEIFGDQLEPPDSRIPIVIARFHRSINYPIIIRTADDFGRNYLFYNPRVGIFIDGYRDGPTMEHYFRL